MRLRHPTSTVHLLFLPSLAAAFFDCAKVRDDKYPSVFFDLHKLKDPHSVTAKVAESPPSYTNMTVTLDICRPLRKHEGVKKDDECPNGTMICGIEHTINPADNVDVISRVIPIARDYHHDGIELKPSWTRLKTSSSHSDVGKEGVRGEFHGGDYQGHKQSAIVEFICDPGRTGLEGVDTPEGKDGDKEKEGERSVRPRNDDKDEDKESSSPLKYISYGPKTEGSNDYLLRLEWKTKYACEKEGVSPGGHWGFFTWFIIIIFLATATYLIFGSWLNYNRYGARGWDLLPHGDTIRDLPYLIRDWTRRVVSTVQGGSSRGGYSAV